jgi:hypothetical protein
MEANGFGGTAASGHVFECMRHRASITVAIGLDGRTAQTQPPAKCPGRWKWSDGHAAAAQKRPVWRSQHGTTRHRRQLNKRIQSWNAAAMVSPKVVTDGDPQRISPRCSVNPTKAPRAASTSRNRSNQPPPNHARPNW